MKKEKDYWSNLEGKVEELCLYRLILTEDNGKRHEKHINASSIMEVIRLSKDMLDVNNHTHMSIDLLCSKNDIINY